MTDDVKIPPLPNGDDQNGLPYRQAWTADQMRTFYLQGYNDGRNAPRVLGAGLDPWPDSGDPAIADALRAPDDAELPVAMLDPDSDDAQGLAAPVGYWHGWNAAMKALSDRIIQLEALLAESQAALAKASRDLMEVSLEARGLGNPAAPSLELHAAEAGSCVIAYKFQSPNGSYWYIKADDQRTIDYWKDKRKLIPLTDIDARIGACGEITEKSGQQGRAPAARAEKSDEPIDLGLGE